MAAGFAGALPGLRLASRGIRLTRVGYAKPPRKKVPSRKKTLFLRMLAIISRLFMKKTLKMRSPAVLVRSSTCPVKNEYGQVRGELQRIISDRVMIKTFVGH